MSHHERAMRMDRARPLVGLAAAVVPFAIVVHLVAEVCSLGRSAQTLEFLIRHSYLAAIFVATTALFCRTVGAFAHASERRRRCALVGALLHAGMPIRRFARLAGANVAFFAVTQLIEGVPIASGDWCLGLAAALIGALVCALFVLIFGRSIARAALGAIAELLRHAAIDPARKHVPPWIAPRCAAAAFSLFIPNRPPPQLFSS